MERLSSLMEEQLRSLSFDFCSREVAGEPGGGRHERGDSWLPPPPLSPSKSATDSPPLSPPPEHEEVKDQHSLESPAETAVLQLHALQLSETIGEKDFLVINNVIELLANASHERRRSETPPPPPPPDSDDDEA